MVDRLDDPRLFVRIVEAGSLKAVAEEIGTNPATVTRRLTALEDRLGVKLVSRSRQGTVPTEAGALYYREIRRLLAEVDAVEADVAKQANAPRGLVRVSCPIDFGARYLVSWVTELQEQNPDLEVDLLLTDAYVDLVGQGVDLAMRIGTLSDSALIARRLGTMPLMMVGSPAYLNRFGRPASPADLVHHHFVRYSWLRDGRRTRLHGPGGKAATIEMRSNLGINNVGAIREAVLLGAGLHLGPEWLFADDAAAGLVEPVLTDWQAESFPVHALFRPGDYLPAKTRAVIDMLVRRVPNVPGVLHT